MTHTSFIRDLANLRENLYVSEAEIFINKYKELLPELPEEGKEEPLTKWLRALQYAAQMELEPLAKSDTFKKNYHFAVRFQDSGISTYMSLTQASKIIIKQIGGIIMATKNESSNKTSIAKKAVTKVKKETVKKERKETKASLIFGYLLERKFTDAQIFSFVKPKFPDLKPSYVNACRIAINKGTRKSVTVDKPLVEIGGEEKKPTAEKKVVAKKVAAKKVTEPKTEATVV